MNRKDLVLSTGKRIVVERVLVKLSLGVTRFNSVDTSGLCADVNTVAAQKSARTKFASNFLQKRSRLSGLALACALLFASASQAQVRFQDTTNAVGGPFHIGETWGSAWGDLDGDIYPDIYSTNHALQNGLYLNNGDGTFTDIVDVADLDRVWIGDNDDGDIHGGSFGDFDNDGDQDIFSTRSSSNSHIQLMENNGQGLFEENSRNHNIRGFGGGRLPLFFDYTNDGNLDVAIARNDPAGLEIFRWSPGSNSYIRTTNSVGITGECLRNNFALISDLFNDNRLHYLCMPESRIAERAYDMSTVPFRDVTGIVDNVGVYTDAVLADFNGDLRQDIFALRGRVRPSSANIVSSTRVEGWFAVSGGQRKGMTFKSNGSISIRLYARDVGEPSGLRIGSSGTRPAQFPAVLSPSNGAHQGVVSNPTGVSVYAGYNTSRQEWTVFLESATGSGENVYAQIDGQGFRDLETIGFQGSDGPVTPALLMNNGSRLVNAGARGIGAVSCGGVTAADFDNDMDIDVYMTCRTGTSNIANRLYLNNGSGQFTQVNSFGGEGPIGVGIDGRRGTAEMVTTGDYDVDGFMDLYVTNGNRLFPHPHKDRFTAGGPANFFRNLGNNNRWLQIDLQGVQSNRDGFGAKVFVIAGGRTQVREQNGMYHRYAHDSRRIHVGLGSNTQANVRIEWPDGSVDQHNNVASNRLYRATQNGALSVRGNGNSGGGTPPPPPPPTNGPELSIEDLTIGENSNNAPVTINLSAPSSSVVRVNFASASGTATDGIDFTGRSGPITFQPGITSVTRTFEINQDNIAEADETFTVSLSSADGATVAQSVATVTILDDDGGSTPPPPPPTPSGPEVSIENLTIDEGTNAAVRINLSEPVSSAVRVNFASASQTATGGGVDFTARSGVITFQPGITSLTRTFTITQDTRAETDETFTVTLSNAQGAGIGQAVATVTIVDDDGGSNTPPPPPPALPSTSGPGFSVDDLTVDEGANNAVVRITLSEALSSVARVSFASTGISARAAGQDYVGRTGVITFQPGVTSLTRTFTIVQDNIAEPDETFIVTLSNPDGADIARAVATVTIVDDDGGSTTPTPPSPSSSGPQINIANLTVDESSSNAVVRITLSEAVSGNVRVAYASSSGSATSGQDFTGRSGLIWFDPGETSLTRTFNITQDNIAEPNETFRVTLSDANGATIGQAVSTVTIIDDDGGSNAPPPPPASSGPEINIEDLTIEESDRNAAVRITLSQAVSSVVQVNFASSSGSATSGQDFTGRSGTISFQPGVTSVTRTFTIAQDSVSESDESFMVTLTNPNGASVGQGIATVTIRGDDGGTSSGGGSNNQVACGQPNITGGSAGNIFLWRDCAGNGRWNVDLAAGGSFIQVEGTLQTPGGNSNVQRRTLESNDSVTRLSNTRIEFLLRASGSDRDGFEFNAPTGGGNCFVLRTPANRQVFVGQNRVPASPDFDFETLVSCN